MKLQQLRDDGREIHDMGTRTATPEDGMYSILKYELGFGGHVVSLTPQGMVVRTNVLGKVDTTHVIFDNEEEHELMATMLYHWCRASKSVEDDKELIDNFMKITKGNPFMVVHGGQVILGASKVQRTLLGCLGLESKPDVVAKLKDMDGKDVVALAELVSEGYTWEAALSLVE
jgi:hypothetical protein